MFCTDKRLLRKASREDEGIPVYRLAFFKMPLLEGGICVSSKSVREKEV